MLPEPMPGVPPGAVGSVEIDFALLVGIRDRIGAGQVAEFVSQALNEAEAACRSFCSGELSSEETAIVAHRLRGTVVSVGLARVGAAAATIEEHAPRGSDLAAPLAELAAAIVAARRTTWEGLPWAAHTGTEPIV